MKKSLLFCISQCRQPIQKPQWKNKKKLWPNEFLQGHPSKEFTDEEKFITLY